jgi:hypothetical protein
MSLGGHSALVVYFLLVICIFVYLGMYPSIFELLQPVLVLSATSLDGNHPLAVPAGASGKSFVALTTR